MKICSKRCVAHYFLSELRNAYVSDAYWASAARIIGQRFQLFGQVHPKVAVEFQFEAVLGKTRRTEF
jgi:hypothetical protein